MALPLHTRPYTIEEYTRTVCPHCFKERSRRADEEGTFIDGMLTRHVGSIWMRRWCPTHGETESLYEEDAAIFRTRAGWQTPTTTVTPDRPGNFKGFPVGYNDGLPTSHGQHSCILLLNVTQNCNYSCPTCYAAALSPGSPISHDKPSLDDLLRTVDTTIEREGGKLSVCMLSGGEPTLRRDLPEILEALANRPVTRVLLNTNGRRILRDPGMVDLLVKHRKKVEVYLQFDAVEPGPYVELRGEDVLAEKLRTLDILNENAIFTTLVMTVKRGVNEDMVSQVLQFGLDRPYVSGVAFQPVFGSGRGTGIDPQSRTTPTGVIKRLAESGTLDQNAFIPLPCSHRDCCDIAYLIRDGAGQWKSLVDLIGRDELKKWIHLVANTISFENASDAVKVLLKEGVIQRVLSEQQGASSLQIAADLVRMCDCVPGVTDLVLGIKNKFFNKSDSFEEIAKRTFRVTVKMFMDADTFHEHRIRQCCVHVGTFEEDPRRYSFCWRWLFDGVDDFPALTPLKMIQ